MFHRIKKGDVLLLAVYLAAALLILLSPVFRSVFSRAETNNTSVLEVRVSGELYGTYDLSQDQNIRIQNRYGSNVLVIQNGSVFMESSDCKNQICVKTGAIHTPGQMIVCLPHRLSAEIRAAGASSPAAHNTDSSANSQGSDADSSEIPDSAASYDAIVR